MPERPLHIRPKPFLLCAIGLFALCLAALLAFLHSLALPADGSAYAYIVSSVISAVASIAGAFVLCGVVETVQAFRSGGLGVRDLAFPAILAAILVLMALGYAFAPRFTGVADVSFGIALGAFWIGDMLWHAFKESKNA